MQALGRPGVVEEPGMHACSVRGNRETPRPTTGALPASPHREGEEP